MDSDDVHNERKKRFARWQVTRVPFSREQPITTAIVCSTPLLYEVLPKSVHFRTEREEYIQAVSSTGHSGSKVCPGDKEVCLFNFQFRRTTSCLTTLGER